MEKKVIVGISSYAGSDTTSILQLVECILKKLHHRPMEVYSLKNYTIEEVVRKINRTRSPDTVYVIKNIRTVAELNLLKSESTFPNATFKAYGIYVDWEDCFKHFQKRGDIPANVVPIEWRNEDRETEHRKNIVKCFNEIGGTHEDIFYCGPGTTGEQAGRMADCINLLFSG